MNTEKMITLKGIDVDLVSTAIGTVICNVLTSSVMSHDDKMDSYEFWSEFRKKFENA